MYIADQENLESFVERSRNSQVLAIDTEFLREKTYYPKLCLLQMASDKESVIVDPFSIKNLQVIVPLLIDDRIVKLFHAAGQDLEIILRETGVLPYPIFDTQIAASLLGHTHQMSYAALVHAECGITLKKLDSLSDWSRRPLSASQRQYAIDDVLYLPRMYESMREALEQKGRLQWLEHDFEELSNPARYNTDERQRFRRLKRVSQLSRRQLCAAQELASWRELEAQRRNLPRKWVMSDEQIVESCKREARSIDQLFMVRGMAERLSTKDARTVVGLLSSALDTPPNTWPEPDKARRSEPNVDIQLDLMHALVRLRSKDHGIAIPTLASHYELARLARGYRDNLTLLKGWRRSIVGQELIELLEGRLCLSLQDGNLLVHSNTSKTQKNKA